MSRTALLAEKVAALFSPCCLSMPALSDVALSLSFSAAAVQMNHHPKWWNVYNQLEIELETHDAQGITQNV